MDPIDKFYALSAPIRQEIVKLLSDGSQLSATTIANKFKVSPPAISQHLKVLLNSDILEVHKNAQKRIYQLNSEAIKELEQWASGVADQLKKISTAIEGDGDSVAPSKGESHAKNI